MEEWKEYKLEDICSDIFAGGDAKKLKTTQEKNSINRIPVYANSVDKDGLYGYCQTPIVLKPAVTVAARGSGTGFVAYRKEPFVPIVRLITLITKNNVDIQFLYYNLKNRNLKGDGSAIPQITIPMIKKEIVSIPNIHIQRKISGILSSLDNKIELNRRINENLEQQAQALFKAWFIDNKNNKLQYYELGNITLITAGGDKPSVYSKDLTEQCRIPIYSNGTENEGLYGYTTSAKINSASITISARGTIGYVCLRTEPYVPIVRLISVVPNIENLSAEYLYLWALTQNINGTGTTQQQLTVPNFRHTLIGIPTKEKMIRFNNIVSPIFQRIVINKNENRILSQLRDTLLPRLMSGELEIEDNSYD